VKAAIRFARNARSTASKEGKSPKVIPSLSQLARSGEDFFRTYKKGPEGGKKTTAMLRVRDARGYLHLERCNNRPPRSEQRENSGDFLDKHKKGG
jgi:hypothetical protein